MWNWFRFYGWWTLQILLLGSGKPWHHSTQLTQIFQFQSNYQLLPIHSSIQKRMNFSLTQMKFIFLKNHCNQFRIFYAKNLLQNIWEKFAIHKKVIHLAFPIKLEFSFLSIFLLGFAGNSVRIFVCFFLTWNSIEYYSAKHPIQLNHSQI